MLAILFRLRIARREGSRFLSSLSSYNDYGKDVFTGKVADEYLKRHGSSKELLNSPNWVKLDPDTVANAVFDWAIDRGANVYCHCFQPLAANGVRFGMTGQIHNTMMEFDENNEVTKAFSGKDLVQSVADGSFFPSGGLKSSRNANGFLAIDTSSPIFCRGDTVFVPSVYVSEDGSALDEKTPLLRSNEALSREGKRLLPCLGIDSSTGLQINLGIEQEFFLVARDQYYRRPDLQLAGRTLMGKSSPRSQDIANHYMAPLSSATAALACLQEIQDEAWSLGIPLNVRHREAAPNQFKLDCISGKATMRIDQNLMVMQILEEIAAKHGLAALLHEKPFDGIKGSSKDIHWSMTTQQGVNLLDPNDVLEASDNEDAFPVIIAAIIAGLEEYGDVMRLSMLSPGNELCFNESPKQSATISASLEDDMTQSLRAYVTEGAPNYRPKTTMLDLEVSEVLPFEISLAKRDKTSLFQYNANGFEFRGLGSGHNVSLANTILNTIVAKKFAHFADRIEAGDHPNAVAKVVLEQHSNTTVDRDSTHNDKRHESIVESFGRLKTQKTISLFEEMKVFTNQELIARQKVLFEHYSATIEMEALVMVDVINERVLPSMKTFEHDAVDELKVALISIEEGIQRMRGSTSAYEKATFARELRLRQMASARLICDEAEGTASTESWAMATYKELQSLDSHTIMEADYFGE